MMMMMMLIIVVSTLVVNQLNSSILFAFTTFDNQYVFSGNTQTTA